MLSSPRVTGLAASALALVFAAACTDTTAPEPPAAPANLQVTQLTLTSVRVSWGSVTGATGYALERADASTPGVFAQVGGSLTDTTYDDTGLTQGLNYSYRVKAVEDSLQSAYSDVASIATGVKAATISGHITGNRTLTADTVYTLSGYVKVMNGATLTIEAGTKIVGDTTKLGSSLWILRGAKIMAVGTADKPIVFTSARSPGNRAPGDWGGIIIIGNGIINRQVGSILTEGPDSVSENYAGGTDNNDSSGQLKYVRVEFAGFDVSNGGGQELNSISNYAVGGGTHFEYVEVLAGLDDGFESWGGAWQGRYLISYESGDDHYDWTEGFRGKWQYIVALQTQKLTPRAGAGTFSSDPRGFEADGCENNKSGCTTYESAQPWSNPTIANFTIVGTGQLGGFPTDGNAIVLRRGTAGWLQNGIIARFKGIGIDIRDEWTDSLMVRDSLGIKNVILAENGKNYDDSLSATTYGQRFRFTSSSHREVATAAELFAANGLNTTSLDFTPCSGCAPTTGGGNLPDRVRSSFFGGTMDNTSFVGAVNPTGPKWWAGWSYYAIN